MSGCKKDGPFRGGDNAIASFMLWKESQVFKAYIVSDSIVVTVPGKLSLTGFIATVTMSENARISPDPGSITDWEKTRQFTVTSYNGSTHTYTYVLQRNIIAKDGDITLMTQSDVDTLATMRLSRINGSLTIGRPAGPDSITSLGALKGIRTITGDLVINPTYAGTDLKGLDSLETIGSFVIGRDISNHAQGPKTNLKNISFPRLRQVMTNMIINGVGITSLNCPELTRVGLDLQVIYVDSLTKVEFPKLESVLQSIIMQGHFTPNVLQTISFPTLATVGGDIYVTSWSNLATAKFPALTRVGNFSIIGESLLTSITAPKLAGTTGTVDLSYNDILTSVDMTSLTKTGGGLKLERVSAIENLDAFKALTAIGGDFFISELSSDKNIDGLKNLKSVGGNFTLQTMDQLSDDNLEGLAALKTIGGGVTINGVPFKKFSGFGGITQLQSCQIYSSGYNTIESIDLTGITITDKITISGVGNGASVKGPAVFNGTLNIESSDLNMTGFTEVKDFTFTDYNGPASPKPLSISVAKATGNFYIAASGYSKVSMPNLTEVGGTCTINLYSYMDLEVPSLTKVAGLSMWLSNTNMDLLSLPQLTSVAGNCEFVTGNHVASIAAIRAPKLTTISGTLTIRGQEHDYENNRMTNLDGFSALTSVQSVTVQHNYALTDYTGLKNVIGGIVAAKWNVSDNGYNPSYQDMVNGIATSIK